MDYPGYFLIVADFINWAKDHSVAVGPGRGSGAGSLVAYALRITDVDPLRYGLCLNVFSIRTASVFRISTLILMWRDGTG